MPIAPCRAATLSGFHTFIVTSGTRAGARLPRKIRWEEATMARKPARKKSAGKPSDGHRDGGGRFLPGNPGGPGRPRGSRNFIAEQVEDLLAGDVEALTRALIRRAKSGHGSALQIAFNILCPVRRDRPVAVNLPPLGNMSEVVAAH